MPRISSEAIASTTQNESLAGIYVKRFSRRIFGGLWKPRLDIPSLIEDFLVNRRAMGATPATLRWYAEVLGRFRRFSAEHPDLDFRSLVHAWARRARRAPSRATGETAIRPVLTLANWLRREGLWNGRIEVKHRTTLGGPKAVALDDVRRLIRALDAETGRLVRFLLATGLRLGEALAVRAGDIDRRTMTIAVTGKGGRIRTVGMGRRMARELRPALKHLDPTAHLFPAPRGAYQQRIRRVAKRLGLVISPHRLRHTFAKEMLLHRRIGLNDLQSLLGHSTPTMTMHYGRLYAHEALDRHRRYAPSDDL